MQSIEEFAKNWQEYCEGWMILEQEVNNYFKQHHWHKITYKRLMIAYTHNKFAGIAYRNVKTEIAKYIKDTYNI